MSSLLVSTAKSSPPRLIDEIVDLNLNLLLYPNATHLRAN